MIRAALLALALGAAAAPPAAPQERRPGPSSTLLAVQAGTIHLVDDGRVLEGGATLVVRDGRVLAVQQGRHAPAGAQVIDYGDDAVIVPGLVAANSTYVPSASSQRTADPAVRAADHFDPYSRGYLLDVAGGVTSAYIAPARNRLIAGQGAVVKLAGDDAGRRVVNPRAALHGSIGVDARQTPGYWEPPVPATVDTGLGVAEPQLPGTTMGAIVALRELIDAARAGRDDERYGPAPAALAEVLRSNLPWRMRANGAAEIRSLLRLARSERLPLIVDGAGFSRELARELADAGVSAIVEVDVQPQRPGRDLGRDRDDRWPDHGVAAALIAAGVPTAIATPDGVRAHDLRFAAQVALREGLDPQAALRAITLNPARMLGSDARIGSLAPGKDADFAVLNGPPLAVTSTVLATWIDGERVWQAPGSAATVLEVEELHVGDGTVLRPGQVLMQDGRIVATGRRVGHPLGAVVVRGAVAMPGMIDAFGHLGLEGSGRVPATDFKLARIVEPGDEADRRVARAGVTTVLLAPRGTSGSGAPVMAYKPAGEDLERMVVADPAALHLSWSDPRNRVESGKSVRDLLEKAVAYDKKWKEYDEALAKWTPPAEEAAAKAEEPKEDDKDEKAEETKGDDEKKGDEAKDKKGKKDAAEEGDPLTGIWEAKVVVPPFVDPQPLRLRLEHEDGKVAGSLRSAAVSESLVSLAGTFAEGRLALTGLGSRGVVSLTGKVEKEALEGELQVGDARAEVEAERTSRELVRAERPERRREKSDEKEPKGKPKAPGVDEKLEPLRRAMRGEGAVVVSVDRRDEIRDCVAAFAKAGIRPILYGADDAWRIAEELEGKVGGILLSPQVLEAEPREGLATLRNRYAALDQAGIGVAFHSAAEEGASELPLIAAYAVHQGMSPDSALRAVTAGCADMFALQARVGRIAGGLDADVLLLDGPPLDPGTRVLRAWVDGVEVR